MTFCNAPLSAYYESFTLFHSCLEQAQTIFFEDFRYLFAHGEVHPTLPVLGAKLETLRELAISCEAVQGDYKIIVTFESLVYVSFE